MNLEVNGEKFTIDWELYKREKEWMEQKEKEYWDYHFSYQRTIDMFGVEGAKKVLERQHKDDMKMYFNHKSRGKL